MLHAVSLVIIVYLVLRYVVRLPVGLATKLLLTGALVLLVKHHWLVARVTGGGMASPEIPHGLLLALSIGFGFLFLLTVLLFLRDVLGVLVWLVSRQRGAALLGAVRLSHGLAVVAAVLAVVAVWQAVKVPQVREVSITLEQLPAELDGYRIVHLTDLHASRLLQGSWIQAVVAKANALQPDVVLISGDIVDGKVVARAADYPPLAQLSAPDGVFGVPGNHEYYTEYRPWMAMFESIGIKMLVNTHVRIGRGSGGIVLAGLADRVAPGRGEPGPDIRRALQGKPAGLPVIVLEHQPRHARANGMAGADLQLSGHTHGGHIRGLDLAVARANNGFVSGRYVVGGMQLYVSNGAGLWAGFPYRLGRPSEITRIVLRSGAVGAS